MALLLGESLREQLMVDNLVETAKEMVLKAGSTPALEHEQRLVQERMGELSNLLEKREFVNRKFSYADIKFLTLVQHYAPEQPEEDPLADYQRRVRAVLAGGLPRKKKD